MRYFVSCSYLNLTYEILSYYNRYQYILFYSNDIIFKIVFLTQLICDMKYEKLFFLGNQGYLTLLIFLLSSKILIACNSA